nr:hypothetical protein Iba_chr03aCG21480 [Ipomoea batatas]
MVKFYWTLENRDGNAVAVKECIGQAEGGFPTGGLFALIGTLILLTLAGEPTPLITGVLGRELVLRFAAAI